jgi:fructan beta-fructosidase
MKTLLFSTVAAMALISTLHAADDVLIADFEGDTYAPWSTTGEAFGPGPARGTLPGQMHVDGFQGKGLVNSFFQGDRTTGTLTSPEFSVERNFIAFLIGGGKNPELLSMQLVVDGTIIRKATGPNDQSGGSEALLQNSWDVRELRGRKAVIRIVDNATGGWGHINVDHIVQTDQKPPGLQQNVQRELAISQRYLHVPIRNGAPNRVITVHVDGSKIVRNDIELAESKPDWWAVMDVAAWKGKLLTLEVDQLPENSTGLSAIKQSDELPDIDRLYQEPLRSQFHFSPQRGWNNDPNGLVWFNGEYHLFFQHNPYGWGWGNMHWGHAVSRDLVHWQELGDKLLPDDFGPMFSGSAVVDWNNTSGFGKDGKPPLVLFYTAAGNPTVQGLAHSTDGRTFTKYVDNPILPQITGGNRDPKVIWHQPSEQWVMVLYVELPGKQHTVHFFTSPNLREWTLASVTNGGIDGDKYLFECPDFFPLATDGKQANTLWVLSGADSQYAVGTFDGKTFVPQQERLPGHRGRGFYAAQTFSDIPQADGRRIQIGWFQTETRGMSFNQSMTIPLELKLISTSEGPRMTFAPVKELQSLRMKSHQIPAFKLQAGDLNPLKGAEAELIELRTTFESSSDSQTTLKIRGATIEWNAKTQELSVNGHRAPAPVRDGRQNLIIYCDRAGLEVFAGDGLTYLPMPYIPRPDDLTLQMTTTGSINVTSLEVHELKSAWTSN